MFYVVVVEVNSEVGKLNGGVVEFLSFCYGVVGNGYYEMNW